ncbi:MULTISPECIES: PP2C family protein-serine/threonine phosphatase [Streptomyces]|uniref:Serine/threonine-protein phosphatase n=1 Tax=Streptomyces fungicidicus TaxID=68203 RepID=A0ACC7XW04_9ACTN|nr:MULTISPECIES: GAF domain-containing SpoIIE family protein phosphatase [Streptomyces]MBF4135598.1 SpoIIE family protein phosphatase [Streptomyces albidoflavus]NUV73884.1 serine/threonine-protein phosphatase [Streptomyces fungicidicus]PAX86913.1 stage II sporulation protein E [Streptomyces albidoflavus]PAX92171.1 stage II sporulation protein E [Streptomyces albidoflavus]PBO15754.1 stage II sporulation protein E [Streptomyces albidoflavus]
MKSGQDREARGWRMLAGLLADSHLMALELLPAKASEYAAQVGFGQVLIYLADLQREVLRPLTGGRDGDAAYEAELPVDGSVAGRAYQYGTITAGAPTGAGQHHWWVPLLDGTERLGVLRIATADEDEDAEEYMNLLASAIALIIESKQGISDAHARLTRVRPLNIAAEMQWAQMAPRTYADGRVVISAAMEPAYTISGDAYDYATAARDAHSVHLSIFDAMGHDTAAGLTAHLAIGACRNARRQGAGPVETAERIEEVLVEQFGHGRYATGLLAELDTRTGVLTWTNRGHHTPVIIRGSRWRTHLECPPGPPMGTDLALPSTLCQDQLEPGDRIVLYTDGVTEARGADDQEFGLTRFTDFLVRHHADGLPVPETLRRLVRALLDHHDGRLQDDATVLICEWLGPEPDPSARAAALVGLPYEPGATPR